MFLIGQWMLIPKLIGATIKIFQKNKNFERITKKRRICLEVLELSMQESLTYKELKLYS